MTWAAWDLASSVPRIPFNPHVGASWLGLGPQGLTPLSFGVNFCSRDFVVPTMVCLPWGNPSLSDMSLGIYTMIMTGFRSVILYVHFSGECLALVCLRGTYPQDELLHDLTYQ